MDKKRFLVMIKALEVLEEMKADQDHQKNPMYRALDRYITARKAGKSVSEAEKESAKETECIISEIREEAINRLAQFVPRELIEPVNNPKVALTFNECKKKLEENMREVFASKELKEKFKNLEETVQKLSSEDVRVFRSAEEAINSINEKLASDQEKLNVFLQKVNAAEEVRNQEELDRLRSGYHPCTSAIDSAISFLEDNGYEVRKRMPVEPPKQFKDHGDLIQLLRYLDSIGIKPVSSMEELKSKMKGDSNG